MPFDKLRVTKNVMQNIAKVAHPAVVVAGSGWQKNDVMHEPSICAFIGGIKRYQYDSRVENKLSWWAGRTM